MTIAYRSATFNYDTVGTPNTGVSGVVTVAKPTGVQAGDVLLAFINYTYSATPGFFGAVPSGWSVAASSGGHPVVLSKTAGSSEPGSYNFNINYTSGGAGAAGGVVLAAYSSDGSGLDGSAVVALNTTSAPSATASSSNDVLVTYFCCVGAAPSVPAGMTQRFQNSGGGGTGGNVPGFDVAIDDQVLAASGATGTRTNTATATIAATVLLVANLAPNAPALNSPANNTTLDRSVTQRFSWTFSDPNSGDTQSKYDLRYSSDNGVTWTTITATTANNYVDVAGGTFAAASYQWQVRTYDSQGLVGPYSSSSFFTAADAPSGPSITYPTSGGTVNASDYVSWSYPTQQAYQVRRVADNAGAADTTTIYFDSGQVVDATSRSLALSFPVNNRYEHIQVRVQDSGSGLWSPYTDIRVLVSYTPPNTPTITAFGVADPDANGYTTALELVYSTAAGSGSVPNATSALIEYSPDGGTTVEHSVKTSAVSGSDVFYTPASGTDYAARVTVTADNGTSSASGWTT